MRPTISCLSERERNVKAIQSPALCKLVLAFPNDMFDSKVHQDALADREESCEVFRYAVNNHKQV